MGREIIAVYGVIMARKLATNSDDTRNLIIKSAFAMFGHKGFDGVSVSDIARETELSKGALYWHFANKEMLYYECLKEFRRQLRACIFIPMEAYQDPLKQLELFFSGTRNLLQNTETVDCAAGYFVGMGRTDQESVNYFRERAYSDTEASISEMLTRGRQQGVFDFKGDPMPAARSLWAIMEGCILQMRRQSNEQINDTMSALYVMVSKGLGVQSPRTDMMEESYEIVV